MATMHVELVSPERELWSGEAKSVFARTLEGELGILPNHTPLFGTLVDGGVVRIDLEDSDDSVTAAIRGGFLSVSDNRVSVLAEWAELGSEVDVEAARAIVERSGDSDDEESAAEARLARARLRAAGEDA